MLEKRKSVALDKTDEDLALEFLTGRINADPVGLRLEPGSKREREGQKALVQLLHSRVGVPLPPIVQLRLAVLLDPDRPAFEDRALIIKYRHGRGVPPNHTRNLEIALDIAAEIAERPGLWDAAVKHASDRYCLKTSTIKRAWRDHKEFAQALLRREAKTRG